MTPFRLSLYIHTPFCRSKCLYCDFPSRPLDAGLVEPWIGRLLASGAERFAELERDYGPCEVDTIFLGGGTPTVIGLRMLGKLLGGIASLLPRGSAVREWTVEANPESLDAEILSLLADHGVDRISLGVQSLQERVLRMAGRAALESDCRRALELLGGSWKGAWSADLICGLPGQDRDGPARDAAEILRHGAGHLSLYSLIIEPGTPFERRAAVDGSLFPTEDEAADAWEMAEATILSHGLSRYEVSNFARPGRECLHNLHYWRMDPWIGLGPSAASSLPLDGGGTLRMREAEELGAWLAGAQADVERLSTIESFEEWLLMGLRTAEGIDLGQALDRFGIDGTMVLGRRVGQWVERGLAGREGGRVRLLRRGLDVMDALLRDCFLDIERLESVDIPHALEEKSRRDVSSGPGKGPPWD